MLVLSYETIIYLIGKYLQDGGAWVRRARVREVVEEEVRHGPWKLRREDARGEAAAEGGHRAPEAEEGVARREGEEVGVGRRDEGEEEEASRREKAEGEGDPRMEGAAAVRRGEEEEHVQEEEGEEGAQVRQGKGCRKEVARRGEDGDAAAKASSGCRVYGCRALRTRGSHHAHDGDEDGGPCSSVDR